MPGFMKNINQIARCAEQYRAERLAPFGLSGCQYSYILNICRTPGISQEQLARQICVNKSNVARQLAQLEEAGFVRREPGERDRRITAVYPTQKAIQVCPRVQAVLGEWSRYITAELTEAEAEAVYTALEKMRRRAGDYLETGRLEGAE